MNILIYESIKIEQSVACQIGMYVHNWTKGTRGNWILGINVLAMVKPAVLALTLALPLVLLWTFWSNGSVPSGAMGDLGLLGKCKLSICQEPWTQDEYLVLAWVFLTLLASFPLQTVYYFQIKFPKINFDRLILHSNTFINFLWFIKLVHKGLLKNYFVLTSLSLPLFSLCCSSPIDP